LKAINSKGLNSSTIPNIV